MIRTLFEPISGGKVATAAMTAKNSISAIWFILGSRSSMIRCSTTRVKATGFSRSLEKMTPPIRGSSTDSLVSLHPV